MMYPITLQAIRLRAGPILDEDTIPDVAHLEWMADEMAKMDDPIRESRWIGWMLCAAEALGWWDNSVSRDLIRVDNVLREGMEPKAPKSQPGIWAPQGR